MSFLRKAAFAAPLALLAPAANAQTMAVPERVPDGVQFVLSVNDSASLWTAYNATALAANVREIMELPDVKQNPDLQEVALEMDKAELELGFATTPGALMGEVLRGFDFYAVKAPGADRPSTLLAARFRNADQAAKLVSYVRARMESDAAAAGQPAQAWQTTNFQGIDIVGEGTDAGNYALMGDVLLLGSTLAVVQDSIASPGASRLTANPQFANTFAKVPAREGQVFFYADAGEMASVANMLNGGSLDASMLPKSRIAGVLSASPEAFALNYYTVSDNRSEAERQLLSIPPGSLAPMLGMVSKSPLFASVSNILDGPTLAKMTEEQAAPAQVAAFRTQVETMLGLSLDDDILPAFGPDIAVAVNSIDLANAFMPSADAAVALRIRDRAKADAVIQKFESRILESLTAQTRAMNPSAPPVQPTLAQEGAVTMRTIALASPGMPLPISVTHAVSPDGVWVVGLGEQSVRRALTRAAGGETMGTVAAQAADANLIPAKFNNISLVNFAQVSNTLNQLLPLAMGMLGGGGQQDMTAPTLMIRTIGSLGVGYVVTVNDGAGSAGYGRLIPAK